MRLSTQDAQGEGMSLNFDGANLTDVDIVGHVCKNCFFWMCIHFI